MPIIELFLCLPSEDVVQDMWQPQHEAERNSDFKEKSPVLSGRFKTCCSWMSDVPNICWDSMNQLPQGGQDLLMWFIFCHRQSSTHHLISWRETRKQEIAPPFLCLFKGIWCDSLPPTSYPSYYTVYMFKFYASH